MVAKEKVDVVPHVVVRPTRQWASKLYFITENRLFNNIDPLRTSTSIDYQDVTSRVRLPSGKKIGLLR